MGIRGLTAALRPFAAYSKLADSVVVDGPAFAYHIFFACRLESRVSTALQDPSYTALGSAAISWLDNLQSRGSKVAAIYFDGYLPESKGDVRLHRLVESSAASNAYFVSTKSGIRTEGDTRAAPAARQAHRAPRIPVPAFTVPSILEALRTSETYGHLTHLVPGEADYFCADHVRREGGALLTSDSDLLLYDLGQHGSVVFLSDLEIVPEESESRPVLTYSQRSICERWSLEPGQNGMLSLAFEIQSDPYQKISYWASQAQKKHSATANPADYADFVSEYINGSDSSLTIPDSLKFLDPRVSEFILSRVRNTETARTGPEEISNPAEPTFYLPLLLDRWDHESAWSPSTWIRQLAYSLCQTTPSVSSTVTEYRRTMSPKSKGQAIELLSEPEMTETAHRLVDSCRTLINQKPQLPYLRWALFCLKQEITYASQEGKESLVKEVFQRAIKSRNRLDPGNWSTVHLTAQMQGTLYSLRMLHQVLKCQGGLLVGTASPQVPVAELLECLSMLPPIKDFPGPTDGANLFLQLRHGELDELLDMTGLPRSLRLRKTATPPLLGGLAAVRRGRAGKLEQRRRPPLSGNPFGALGPGS
ncbi:hypothetical protein KVR01_003751 [Diaporthe batatas]|uniref:uncharacterized protein n=1 Tax=Diaporthe batatas TaxID=748121 RepID=UPI001D04852F|nr:uncharacterized protein KVR01_003751 [Diaporthe batatas]KAG8168062.1 hypothetical protein KVR01_003751 [Diaporthe batatas]